MAEGTEETGRPEDRSDEVIPFHSATHPRSKFYSGALRPKVTVVIPAQNEERNLPWVLGHLPKGLHEVILVDGHSTDRTVEVAQESYPGIKVIKQGASGKGAALVTGMLSAQGDIIVMMDADGSMDPIEINGLVGMLLSGADVVKASRYVAGGGSHDISRLRDLGNRGLAYMARALYRHGWSELCYGLAAFWSDTLPALGLDHVLDDGDPGDKHRYGRGFEIETLLFTRAYRLGLKVAEIPSFEYPRIHGDSNLQTFPDGWRVATSLIREKVIHPKKAPSVTPQARAAAKGTPAVVMPPSAQDDVGVVITTHSMERWGFLESAVHSVLQQDPAPAHLMIVVDRNTPLWERAQETYGDVATVIQNTRSPGLSGARNSALAALESNIRIVAFLDDDAEAQPGWLKNLTDPLQPGANPGVLITSGWADPVWPDGRPPEWFPTTFNWVVGCSWTGLPTVPADIRNPLGATMAFRREVFERVGGFSEDMGRIGNHPVGCEETELAIRLTQNQPSARVLHLPAAQVTQVVPPSRARWTYFRRRCWAEGLSKAVVTQKVGAKAGLASEKEHTKRLLSSSVRDASAGKPHKALATVAGLAITGSGFLAGRVMKHSGKKARGRYHG